MLYITFVCGMPKPQCIKHYPGVILDVVVSTPSASDATTSSAAHSKVPAFCDRTSGLSGTSAEPPIDDNIIEELEITTSNGNKQIVRLEQRNSFEQRLVSFLPPDIQTQVLASSDVHEWVIQAIQNGQVDRLHEQLIACLQHLKDEMAKNNGLVSDVKELALKNNELASTNNGLVSDVKELALKNNELVTDVKDLTIKNTELSTNIIKIGDHKLAELLVAVAQHRTHPITLAFRSLCIPPLRTRSHQGLAPHQYLGYLLNGANVDELKLFGDAHEEAVVDAFARLESTSLKTLELQSVSREVGSQCFKNLATVVSRSELRVLGIHLEREWGRALILESIQWKHLRRLDVTVNTESVGRSAMKALVEGRDKWDGPAELDHFMYLWESSSTVSVEQRALWKSIVASTSIKDLWLHVRMAPSDMELVLKTADVSRLENIALRADGFSSSQVDRVLDCLTDARNLRWVGLHSYRPTLDQKARMQARGVDLQ
ncbi:hypothetical protein BGX31_011497 [Mortierella sp. GBA43]|nr:hypothetical protein BGX31_011497 [Mortierella sp. GBA43]